MRTGAGLTATLIGIFAAFLIQQSLPAIHGLQGARVFLVPLIFCYAAMVLPFSLMLVCAFLTGLMCDLMYLHSVGGRVEIAVGCSIIYFVILGSIANGVRPSYLDGHWWPVIPISALGTSCYLLMQFVMISVRREGFVFEEAVLWRIVAPGLLAAALAPLLHFIVSSFSLLIPGDSPRSLRS